ncbi:DUF4229 domain-containing protein [Corynebacterium pacaense]|uniref:DUF4229 domain-containing protein n=1 Tax=Corynebacterium pacaense TaxID=1816684 RepID=UPI0009B9EBB2|nr:DUF4229 domain-containing protein [Corynebacterium pacaense]
MSESISNQQPELDRNVQRSARRNVIVYAGARVLLVVVLTLIIQGLAWLISSPVPLVMSAMLALVVAFPLSMLIFDSLRINATRAVGQWDAQRRAHRAWVQQELADR